MWHLIILAAVLGFTVDSASAFIVADKVLVNKTERKLYLLRDGKTVREFSVSLGRNPSGHKTRQGDDRTPEGNYFLDWRNPQSKFYKSIHISYPNRDDRTTAWNKGFDPGGMIMIHGLPKPFTTSDEWIFRGCDWTDGCIAVTNNEMDMIWKSVKDGTPIEIIP